MKNISARTEVHTIWVALGQEANETPYVLREGRLFAEPPKEIVKVFSGSRLVGSSHGS